jgi:hypothetical protein
MMTIRGRVVQYAWFAKILPMRGSLVRFFVCQPPLSETEIIVFAAVLDAANSRL